MKLLPKKRKFVGTPESSSERGRSQVLQEKTNAVVGRVLRTGGGDYIEEAIFEPIPGETCCVEGVDEPSCSDRQKRSRPADQAAADGLTASLSLGRRAGVKPPPPGSDVKKSPLAEQKNLDAEKRHRTSKSPTGQPKGTAQADGNPLPSEVVLSMLGLVRSHIAELYRMGQTAQPHNNADSD